MLGLRVSAFAAVAALAITFSASEGSAEQKLCVSSTGATRVIETPARCRNIETAVNIPAAVKGETIETSSYLVPRTGNGGYLDLFTADGGSQLSIYCTAGGNSSGWFAADPSVKAGEIKTFNAISGQPFQAFSDLYWGGGGMDATYATRPWTGVFTAKYGQSLSRFEVTVSEVNKRGDCLVTLFAIGLGRASINQLQ